MISTNCYAFNAFNFNNQSFDEISLRALSFFPIVYSFIDASLFYDQSQQQGVTLHDNYDWMNKMKKKKKL